jgi:flagellar hook protein FlgE
MIKVNAASMMAHQTLMDINANNVANVNTQDFKASEAHIENNLEVSENTTNSGTDLTKELTDQIVIEDGFKAQVPAIKTQDEMTKTLLDIKA